MEKEGGLAFPHRAFWQEWLSEQLTDSVFEKIYLISERSIGIACWFPKNTRKASKLTTIHNNCPPLHCWRSNLLADVNPFSPNRKVASRLNWGLRLYLKGVNNFGCSRLFWAGVKRLNTHFSNGKTTRVEVGSVILGCTRSTFSCHILKDVSVCPTSLCDTRRRLISLCFHRLKTWSLLLGLRCLFCQSKHWFELHSMLLAKKKKTLQRMFVNMQNV